ncbi:MAG: ATP-binding protein [Candidatus Sumerlaeia bacterium]|nr:ATP-binding protein [Candidatus Sumerlaeia bacterium]
MNCQHPIGKSAFLHGAFPPDWIPVPQSYQRVCAEELSRSIVPLQELPASSDSALFGCTVPHQHLAQPHRVSIIPLWAQATDFRTESFASCDCAPLRVCLFGCESTGKTQLAEQLARHFKTVASEEYARTWFTFHGDQGTLADIPKTARGQWAVNRAAELLAPEVVFFDSDLLLTQLWSESLFGECPEEVSRAAQENLSDLYLLTDIDLPWEPDPQRCFPHPEERAQFHARAVELLKSTGRPWVLIQGSGDARLNAALQALRTLS